MFDRIFSHGSLHAAAHLGFFSGISMMLPVMSKAWEMHLQPWLYSPHGFYISVGLILFSLILIGFLAGSASKLCRSLGWLIIVPGAIAIIFTAFGQTTVYDWVGSHMTGFVAARPAVDFFVEHSVPKTSALAGMYVLLGVGFIWTGSKLKHFSKLI